MNRVFILIVTIIGTSTFFTSCNSQDTVHIYSPDKSQSITVISDNNVQYVINGEHNEVPKKNYIKLDISKKDLEVDNALNICWGNQGIYIWEVVVSNTSVIENRLDSTKYKFDNKLPIDENGVPTEEKFRGKSCATVSFILKRTSPPSNTTVIFR